MKGRWNRAVGVVGTAALALAVAGCGGSGERSSGGGSGAAPSADSAGDIKVRTVESLPEVGDYLPPLDDGRIEVAPPEGWNLLPRRANYVAGFVKGKASEMPRITLTAWDTPLPEVTELTEANADLLEAELVRQFKKDKKAIQEPPLPIVLGDTLYLRYVRLAKTTSGSNLVIQALETVRGGRLYSIELFADVDAARAEEYEASLTKWRDHGYAVAAHLKFLGESTTEPSSETNADPPAESTGVQNPTP
jgi:hypothetical protein